MSIPECQCEQCLHARDMRAKGYQVTYTSIPQPTTEEQKRGPYWWAYAWRDGVAAAWEEMKDDILMPRLAKKPDGTYEVRKEDDES